MVSGLKRLLRVLVVLVPAAVFLGLVGWRVLRLQQAADPYAGCSVLLSEAVSKNLSGLTDADGDRSDWIELYNPTDEDISLAGWGLSDDGQRPYRWTFEDTVLPAHGYLVVFASRKDRRTGEELHTNFALSGDGETLHLTDAEGREVDTLALPKQNWDIPYGRRGLAPDECGYFEYATPGQENPPSFLTKERDNLNDLTVEFSHPGGFYDESFSLTLSCGDPEALIVYTTDGSEPTIGSEVYTGPLTVQPPDEVKWARQAFSPLYKNWLYRFGTGEIDTCFVVRAAVYKDGTLSQPVTQSYWLSPQTTLPVVSLTTDPDGLFDKADGLYVPGAFSAAAQRTGDDEIAYELSNSLLNTKLSANVEVYDADGRLLLNQSSRISLAGAASRLFSPSKSFRVRLDEGDFTFEMEGQSYTLSTFDLRAPRTDEDDALTYRDAFGNMLLADEPYAAQAQTAVQLYLDGEYWGIYYLKEPKNEALFEDRFGVQGGELESVKFNEGVSVQFEADGTVVASVSLGALEGQTVEQGGEHLLQTVSDWYEQLLQADLCDAAQYAALTETMDVESYTRYMAIEIYLNNTDWGSNGNNALLWRTRTVDESNPYADGRWRFMIYDLDHILLDPDRDTLNAILTTECDPEEPWDLTRLLFQKLWQRQDFRSAFAAQVEELTDTLFAPQSLLARWQAHIDALRPEIGQALERVKIVKADTPLARLWHAAAPAVDDYIGVLNEYTLTEWEESVRQSERFITERPQRMAEFLAQALAAPLPESEE